jgi:hypothetical protein
MQMTTMLCTDPSGVLDRSWSQFLFCRPFPLLVSSAFMNNTRDFFSRCSIYYDVDEVSSSHVLEVDQGSAPVER